LISTTKGVAPDDVAKSEKCIADYLRETPGSTTFDPGYRLSGKEESKCKSIEFLVFDSVCKPLRTDFLYGYRQRVWELSDPNTGQLSQKAGLRSNVMEMFPSPYTSAGSLSGDIGSCPAQLPGRWDQLIGFIPSLHRPDDFGSVIEPLLDRLYDIYI
jgi:hypothetical protein